MIIFANSFPNSRFSTKNPSDYINDNWEITLSHTNFELVDKIYNTDMFCLKKLLTKTIYDHF